MPYDDVHSVLDLLALPMSTFVQTSYTVLLGRMPDPAELKARASVLRAGWGRRRLLADMAGSSEFKARQERLLLAGDDAAFVDRLYRSYFDRVPDPDGRATYLGFLRKGQSRARIRRAIATSREARLTGGFAFELDLLIAEEASARRPFGRWLGRSGRLERRRNQDWEIMCRQSPAGGGLLRVASGPTPDGSGAPQQDAQAATAASLAKVDPASLTRDARRTLSRLRHFGGIAGQSEGTA